MLVVGAFTGPLTAADRHDISASADVTVIQAVSPSINSASLYQWRQPQSPANTLPIPSPTGMTFEYFQNGINLPYPTGSNPGDHTANAQGDLWSNNAIRLDYQPGNTPNDALLIYTFNDNKGDVDPIGPVVLRGGLVGGAGCNVNCLSQTGAGSCSDTERRQCAGRSSILPLIWKALSEDDIKKVSNVSMSGTAVPNDSPMWLPTEIEAASPSAPGVCPAEGPYNQPAGAQRINNGFCDFSTHYMMDQTNLDPDNLWYANPAVKDRIGAFNYASVVGPYGVNITERGLGNGRFSPVYIVLGVRSKNAIRSQYQTVIYLEALAR